MEQVSIKVPASPAYVRVVRLVASGLASRLMFTIDDIDDLKIAVDELSGYLTGPECRDGTLHVRFALDDDAIQITGVGDVGVDDYVKTVLSD